jgi:hypothetical protein
MTEDRKTILTRRLMASRGIYLSLAVWIGGGVMAAPPVLYRQPAYESPVRADPDDLLLLAGYGFAADDLVVYRAVAGSRNTLSDPARVPAGSTAEIGLASIVSTRDVPYSLTIKLPPVLRRDRSYALWVRTAGGEWSKPVTINDARPLWFTPAYVYASGPAASLPRELKIVGRNLQPNRGRSIRIRLRGARDFTYKAVSDGQPGTLDEFVARVRLPTFLAPGLYRVQLSRDDVNWTDVPDQSLEVRPDPAPGVEFSVGDPRFGGCRPDDDRDDTGCILRALAAAQRAGGGSVYFEPGTWDLIDSAQPGLGPDEGIVVPPRVMLRGAGSALTRVARHAEWSERAPAAPAFTLLGDTRVSGFTFRDLKAYEARDRAGPFLQLGKHFERVGADSSASRVTVDSVVVTDNVFDKTMVAIGNGGLPIRRLFITYNTFGAFNSALELAGDRFNTAIPYRIDDAIIAHNLFKPGSKLDLIGKTGTMASELGAGHRVDFSDNTADGAATDFLYSPDDARGWRAAFFWNLTGNVEEVLVSQNTATCTGDKIGDGEALAFDTNANTFAFQEAPLAAGASAASVSVSAPLISRQNDRDVPAASYYVGHWVQVASGPGVGQARKIISYATDPITHVTTFGVAPDWDVVPVPGRTRIAVGREFWQLYVIDNRIDSRRPLCQKSNRSAPKAGMIVLWAQSADSVIAGNRQYDSDGIFVQQAYVLPDHPCGDCSMQSLFQSFLDIRANTVNGEYDWTTSCSASGIAVGVAAAPGGSAPPPTVGFGVSVSHNAVQHADALHGGAVAQLDSWYSGPPPHRWPLSDNLIIQHNSIADIAGARAVPSCGKSYSRTGIAFPDYETAWRTVLYANSCKNVSTRIGDGGVETVKVCPSSAQDSCECPPTVR